MATLQELLVKIGADIGDYVSNIDGAISKGKEAGASLTSIGATLSAGLTAPLTAVGGTALKAATDIASAFRDIRVGTGATGDALKDLQGSFRTVFADVDESASQVSKTLVTLSQKLGLTGEPLEQLSKQVLDLSEITKSDLNSTVESTARVFAAWSVATKDQADTLDYLFKVTQNSGISIGKLEQELADFGPTLQNLGFSLKDAALLLGNLDKQGVDAAAIIPGLRKEFSNLAKDGIDGAAAFKQIVAGIEDGSISLQKALQIFGEKQGATVFNLIKAGKLDFDNLKTAVESSGESISTLADQTETLGKAMGKAWNQVELALQPLGNVLKTALRTGFEDAKPLLGVVQDLGQRFADLSPQTQTAVVAIGGLAAAAGPAALAIAGIQKAIGLVAGVGAGVWAGVTAGFTALVATVRNVVFAVQTGLVGALSTGELALLRFGQAAAGLGAAFVAFDQLKSLEGHLQTQFNLLQELSPKFKEFATTVQNSIENSVSSAVPYATEQVRKFQERFPEVGDAAEEAKKRVVGSLSDIADGFRNAFSADPVKELKQTIIDSAGPIGALNNTFSSLETLEQRLIDTSKVLRTNWEQLVSDLAQQNLNKFQSSLSISQQALEDFAKRSGIPLPAGGNGANAATANGPRLPAPGTGGGGNIDLSGLGKGADAAILSADQLIKKQAELQAAVAKASAVVADLTAREQAGQPVAVALAQAHDQLNKALKDVAQSSTDVTAIMRAAMADQSGAEARINALNVAYKSLKEIYDRTGEGAAALAKVHKDLESALQSAGQSAADLSPSLANLYNKYSDGAQALLKQQTALEATAEKQAQVFNEISQGYRKGELDQVQLQKAFDALKQAVDAAGISLADLDTKVGMVGNGIPVLVGGVEKFVSTGSNASSIVNDINKGLQDLGASAGRAGSDIEVIVPKASSAAGAIGQMGPAFDPAEAAAKRLADAFPDIIIPNIGKVIDFTHGLSGAFDEAAAAAARIGSAVASVQDPIGTLTHLSESYNSSAFGPATKLGEVQAPIGMSPEQIGQWLAMMRSTGGQSKPSGESQQVWDKLITSMANAAYAYWANTQSGGSYHPYSAPSSPADKSTQQLQISGIDPTLLAATSAAATKAINEIANNTANLLMVVQDIRNFLVTGQASSQSLSFPSGSPLSTLSDVFSSTSDTVKQTNTVFQTVTDSTGTLQNGFTLLSQGLGTVSDTFGGFVSQLSAWDQMSAAYIESTREMLRKAYIAQYGNAPSASELDSLVNDYVAKQRQVGDAVTQTTQNLGALGNGAGSATGAFNSFAQVVSSGTAGISDSFGGFVSNMSAWDAQMQDYVNSVKRMIADAYLKQNGTPISSGDLESLTNQYIQNQRGPSGPATPSSVMTEALRTIGPAPGAGAPFWEQQQYDYRRNLYLQIAQQHPELSQNQIMDYLDSYIANAQGPAQGVASAGAFGPLRGPTSAPLVPDIFSTPLPDTWRPVSAYTPPRDALNPGAVVNIYNPTVTNRSMLDDMAKQLSDLAVWR